MAEETNCTSRLILILVHVQAQPPPGLPQQGTQLGWGHSSSLADGTTT